MRKHLERALRSTLFGQFSKECKIKLAGLLRQVDLIGRFLSFTVARPIPSVINPQCGSQPTAYVSLAVVRRGGEESCGVSQLRKGRNVAS